MLYKLKKIDNFKDNPKLDKLNHNNNKFKWFRTLKCKNKTLIFKIN